jgi:hypothetical protein
LYDRRVGSRDDWIDTALFLLGRHGRRLRMRRLSSGELRALIQHWRPRDQASRKMPKYARPEVDAAVAELARRGES